MKFIIFIFIFLRDGLRRVRNIGGIFIRKFLFLFNKSWKVD